LAKSLRRILVSPRCGSLNLEPRIVTGRYTTGK